MSDREQDLPEKMQIQHQNIIQTNNIQNKLEEQIQQDVEEVIQYEELNQEQYEQYVKQVQQNSKKLISQVQVQGSREEKAQAIQTMKNPVSAYLIFTMKWKTDNPTKKFSMSHLGELWKSLQPHEKRQFEEEYRRRKQKYDLYVAEKLIRNPNAGGQEEIQNKFFFPLHRIKAIMRQDKYYSPKTQAVTAMARAAQYFGEYFLEQLKKITQGKGRIDTKDLFQCVSVNQRIFGFLDCLIDDYAESSKQKKIQKPIIQQQKLKQKQSPVKESLNVQIKRPGRQPNQTSNVKPLPKGQTKLTDMFVMNNAK